jgi:hypothetical protein
LQKQIFDKHFWNFFNKQKIYHKVPKNNLSLLLWMFPTKKATELVQHLLCEQIWHHKFQFFPACKHYSCCSTIFFPFSQFLLLFSGVRIKKWEKIAADEHEAEKKMFNEVWIFWICWIMRLLEIFNGFSHYL